MWTKKLFVPDPAAHLIYNNMQERLLTDEKHAAITEVLEQIEIHGKNQMITETLSSAAAVWS